MESYNEHINWMRLATPNGLLFNTFSTDEIRKLSTVKIITPLSFDPLGHPLPGGLYDPVMGPLTYNGLCTTCGMLQMKCTGHFGHIDLPVPVLNPLYHKSVIWLLKMSCLQCARILIPHAAKCLLIGQCTLLHHGYLVEAQEIENKFIDLVKASSWDHQQSEAESFDAARKINDFVTTVCMEKESVLKEWKGEADLRNAFIRNATSKLFKGTMCPFCQEPMKTISTVKNSILIPTKLQVAGKFRGKKSKKTHLADEIPAANFSFLMPSECKELLKRLFLMDGEFIKALLPVLVKAQTENPIDSLFMEVVPVTPIATRPVNIVDGRMSEHPSNCVYQAILNDCLVLRTLMLMMDKKEGNEIGDQLNTTVSLSKERCDLVEQLRGKTYSEKFQYSWQALQQNVDSLLDIDALNARMPGGIGLKQILEKKEGIIRMNMMGKRVNFAARTVITPDPNLNIDEVGIPEVFAKKLSYPVPVTYFNVNELRKMVINGPFLHPGANLIENEDGSIIKLDGGDLSQREGLAKKLLTPSDKKGIKIVHRHVINGDILLFNRQPTLHKPSIMAHRARVLKGEKTFRMHYANCKSYNADFDGDEMNAHLPQNEVARSEGYNLVSVSKQYLVPKDGTPLSGLIQDHVVSGVRLTIRGRFFTRDEYMQLCFQGLSSIVGRIKCLPPCLIKPAQLWSGKQVISTIILNLIPAGLKPINLTSTSKIRADAWLLSQKDTSESTLRKFSLNPKQMSEAEVVIRDGELLCGVLDKMHYGATPYSLVHCVHELYGSEVAAKLLSSFSKLFTAFLQTQGFTLGVEDILVVNEADTKRRDIIDKVRSVGCDVAAKVLDSDSPALRENLCEAHWKDPTFRSLLDHSYKVTLDKFTNEINKTCLPKGLHKKFPVNDLQLMVESGAKGSTVNTMQISCLLGQIELEGRRPPLMISGRSLPSFPPFDPSPRSGGFVDGRFMTGIHPQEFFFHCMAGREGLIDTAVKTSRSGYLQRCLVKHLEGLSVNYDLTVRDSDGSIIQFLYGEDGMEVTKCQFIRKEQLPFLADNVQALLVEDIAEEIKAGSDLKSVKKLRKALKKWHKSNSATTYPKPSPFSLYTRQLMAEESGNQSDRNYSTKWLEEDEECKKRFQKMCQREPDTIVSKLQPDRHFGSVTEKLDAMVNNYLNSNEREVDAKIFEDVVYFKALSALANPGEPVGLLAAQSIGEPSTQMTLNTFHFAGRGEMNVTLGIPRLREVLMSASKNIKTPSMEIPFNTKVKKLEKKADQLRRKLARVAMSDVLECVEVHEKLQLKPRVSQLYTLTFKFLPKDAFIENSTVTHKQILKYFEKYFIKALVGCTKNRTKSLKNLIESEMEKKSSGRDDPDDEGADEPAAVPDRKKKGVAGAGNDYQSSEDEEENDDDDATAERRRARQNEEHQYSDLEDEDEDVQAEIEGTHVTKSKEVEEDESELGPQVDYSEEKDRVSRVKSINHVESYSFDTHHQQWCQVVLVYPPGARIDFSSILKELAPQSVISQVPGIRKAFLPTTADGTMLLKTDGKNLKEMYNYYELLDLNRLYTNDIHAVAEAYGIEAANKVIVKEIQEVFKVYGITVDTRHLSLIADYMTFDGTYRALNRLGMEGGASPLQQMSFEASTGFLRSSVLRSKRDDILSPSSCLMLGRPVSSGTSCFNLLYSINAGKVC